MGMAEGVYTCPQCCSPLEEIPTQCPVCDLRLLSSAELTKTHHHLFPVPSFTEALRLVPPQPHAPSTGKASPRSSQDGKCFGCRQPLPIRRAALTGKDEEADRPDAYVGAQCPECSSLFCIECDDLVHETLHSCPGCACLVVETPGAA